VPGRRMDRRQALHHPPVHISARSRMGSSPAGLQGWFSKFFWSDPTFEDPLVGAVGGPDRASVAGAGARRSAPATEALTHDAPRP
jgi:hypothetical protein